MIFRVAVADHEVDVLADPLGAERGATEAGRHGEKVGDPAIAERQDGGHLGGLDVDAGDRHVELGSLVGGERFAAHRQRVARVEPEHRVADREVLEVGRVRRVRFDADDPRGPGPAGGNARQDPTLAARAEDEHAHPGPHQPLDLRRGAGDVERGEGQALGKIGRQARVRAAREEHRFAFHVELGALGARGGDAVDPQRRERQ